MSAKTPAAYIEVTIRESQPDGSTRFTSRWVRHNAKGWSSSDNLGRDYAEHLDEGAARRVMGGWLRSQGEKLSVIPSGKIPVPAPEIAPDLPEREDPVPSKFDNVMNFIGHPNRIVRTGDIIAEEDLLG